MDLIYCAAGTRRLAEIALTAGYRYGARLPDTVYFSPWFADQDWHRPNRGAYMAALAQYRPAMATVLDFERADQRAEVLSWAEEAAQWAARVLIIPKAFSTIAQLPRRIGGAEIVLAYSVPTRYGGTSVPVWEFAGWPIHLLGGSPQAQMHAYQHLHAVADVVSADGNYAQKMAVRFCQYWVPGTARGTKNRWWPQLQETDGWQGHDAPYEAFRRSCAHIMAAWRSLGARDAAATVGYTSRAPVPSAWRSEEASA